MRTAQFQRGDIVRPKNSICHYFVCDVLADSLFVVPPIELAHDVRSRWVYDDVELIAKSNLQSLRLLEMAQLKIPVSETSEDGKCRLFQIDDESSKAGHHNASLAAEKEALRLLYPGWDTRTEAQREADLHTMQWTIQSLMSAGFEISYPGETPQT